MLNFKGMRFPIDVILVCVRWYVAYPLSYRHLEMMEERGVLVDHSSINRWAIRFLPLIVKMARKHRRPVGGSWRGWDLHQGQGFLEVSLPCCRADAYDPQVVAFGFSISPTLFPSLSPSVSLTVLTG